MQEFSKKSRKERWKDIFAIAWPLIVANSFWNLQLTIDRIYLGNFSTEALGAAVAVMGVFWTPMALLQQTAGYVMTFVAQYFGAKRDREIGSAVWQAIHISIIGGIFFIPLMFLADPFFSAIGHPDKLRPLEVSYFSALCFSALPAALVAAASGFFTGLGDSKIIMRINCVGLIANVVFDYFFIFGRMGFPAMGIAGAGYATALANYCSALYGLYLVFVHKEHARYELRTAWRMSADLMRRFLKYGIPSGLQWALEGLAFTVFLIIVGRMDNAEAALSASGIAVTIMMLAVLPALGVAQAVSVKVGQYLGDEKPNDAEAAAWTGLQIAFAYIASVGLTFVLFPHFYLSWFQNSDNPSLWAEVSIIVPYLLMFIALFTAFDSMNLVFSFALKGAGDTRFVTLIALSLPWPFMVAPTWLFREMTGAVYWAWGAASVFIILQALVFLHRFHGGKWKSMSVIN